MSDLKEEQKAMEMGLEGIKAKPLTLTLEENTQVLAEPVLGSVQAATADSVFNAGSTDETMLSPEEKKQVEEFVKQIDISDVKVLNSYGSSAQKGISTFSTSITGKVKTKEFGEVGDSLRDLRAAINSTVAPEKKGLLGLFQKGKNKVTYLISNYESAETNVQKIEKDLQRHQQVLTKDDPMSRFSTS